MTEKNLPPNAMHDVLDTDAVEALHRDFVERLRAKPGFKEAVDKVNHFANTTLPPVRDTMKMNGAPAIEVSPVLLPKSVPIEALGRALSARTDEAGRDALLWAYSFDVSKDTERKALETVAETFRERRRTAPETTALELTPHEIRSVLADIAASSPAVLEALRECAHVPTPGEALFGRSVEEPAYRAFNLKQQFGLDPNDPLIDDAPFLALAEAVEVVWLENGGVAAASMGESHLRSVVSSVQDTKPDIVVRALAEVERVERLHKLARLKKAADERAAAGVVVEPSKAVYLSPEIAPPIPEEKLEVIEEPVRRLPSAQRKTTTRIVKRPQALDGAPLDGGETSPDDAIDTTTADESTATVAAPRSETTRKPPPVTPVAISARTEGDDRDRSATRSRGIVAAAILLLLASVAVWWFVRSRGEEPTATRSSASAQQPRPPHDRVPIGTAMVATATATTAGALPSEAATVAAPTSAAPPSASATAAAPSAPTVSVRPTPGTAQPVPPVRSSTAAGGAPPPQATTAKPSTGAGMWFPKDEDKP